MVNRERVRDATTIAVGRNDDDLADFAKRLGERADTRALDPVVVGDENAQIRLPNA
jgi:hypothetical protein